MDYSPPGSSVHTDSPGKNTGMASHALLQGIFPTQGSNSGLLGFRTILYHMSHQGSPRILEWVDYTFSRGTSQLRNPTRISCIVGEFFTSWATREALGTRIIKFDSWQAEAEGRMELPFNRVSVLSRWREFSRLVAQQYEYTVDHRTITIWTAQTHLYVGLSQ